jgi:hypothetical protein
MLRTSLILILLAAATFLQGQNLKGWSIDASIHQGRIIRHSPKLAYPIPRGSTGAMLDFRYQTYGRKDWQEWRNYPEIGVTLEYYYPGDAQILGHVFGVVPHLNLHLIERESWLVQFQLGTGLAYFTRPYDAITNPLNNAIGSHLTNLTVFRLQGGWKIDPNWTLRLGGSFSHFSNAAAKSPNLGMNIPAISLGAQYTPKPIRDYHFQFHGRRREAEFPWGFFVDLNLGFRENSNPGGPKLPVYQTKVAARFSLNRVNDLQAGFMYEYQRSVYEFMLNSFSIVDKAEARQAATRWMFFLADEFRFGQVGIYLMAGVYISPKSQSIPAPIANNLGLRYYFRLPGRHPREKELYLGVLLKAHRAVAEYAAIGGGLRF